MDEVKCHVEELLKDECKPVVAPTVFDQYPIVLLFHTDYFKARRAKRRRLFEARKAREKAEAT